MAAIDVLGDDADGSGNTISSQYRLDEHVSVTFRGKDNRLSVAAGSELTRLTVVFHGDGGSVEIGRNATVGKPQLNLRVGHHSSIHIGDNVWLGYEAIVLRGSTIGSGSVIGIRSIVTSKVPNNCVAAGSPARVVRRDIAWERPYLWLSEAPEPWPELRAEKSPHWQLTSDS